MTRYTSVSDPLRTDAGVIVLALALLAGIAAAVRIVIGKLWRNR